MKTVEISTEDLKELLESKIILHHLFDLGIDDSSNFEYPDNLEQKLNKALEEYKNG